MGSGPERPDHHSRLSAAVLERLKVGGRDATDRTLYVSTHLLGQDCSAGRGGCAIALALLAQRCSSPPLARCDADGPRPGRAPPADGSAPPPIVRLGALLLSGREPGVCG